MLKKILHFVTVFVLCISFIIGATYTVFAASVYEEYNCFTQQKKSYTTHNWEEVDETPSHLVTDNTNYDIQPFQVVDDCNLTLIDNPTVTPITRA